MEREWKKPELQELKLRSTNEDHISLLSKPRPEGCYCDTYDVNDGNSSHNHAHGAMKNKKPGDLNYCECCYNSGLPGVS